MPNKEKNWNKLLHINTRKKIYKILFTCNFYCKILAFRFLYEFIVFAENISEVKAFMLDRGYEIGLSALLEHDLSSYEFFYSLSKEIQNELREKDAHSFEEMQAIAARFRQTHK